MSTSDIKIKGRTATLHIHDFTPENYDLFLGVKSLPRYDVRTNSRGYVCTFPAEYAKYLGHKESVTQDQLPLDMPDFLFDRQQVGARVGWNKQRYAFFYDAGLGKTLLFAELARQLAHTGKKILIVSPLNVIHQTIEEIERFYNKFPAILNLHTNHQKTIVPHTVQQFINSEYQIAIVNHEYFIQERNLDGLDCIILDESSILKASHGRISKNLIECSKGITYKFCFSATPAPNDRKEYAKHALFLELVRSENEFLARFFVTKDNGWVLRKHGVDKFYKYLASWSIFIRNPERYGLEPVTIPPYQEITQKLDMVPEQIQLINKQVGNEQLSLGGMPHPPKDWHERQTYNQVSKGFLYTNDRKDIIYVPTNKPKAIRDFLAQYPGEQTIIWTVYDEEGEIIQRDLEEHTRLRVVQLTGKTSQDKRAALITDFRHGVFDVLISKPRLLGLGLNLHMATVQVWSGLRDSYEQLYQGIKRSWRYPQQETVKVFLPYTEHEKAILDNVISKRDAAEKDYEIQEQLYTESLYEEIQDYLTGDFVSLRKDNKEMVYDPVITDDYQLYHTDSVKATLDGLAENSVDLAVFSPPFPADIFAYTSSTSDLGNTGGKGIEGNDEYLAHLEFCLTGVFKTLKQGRICAIEIQQSPRRKGEDGVIGMYDSRGDIIRVAEKIGFYQVGEWPVLGNPQAEAIIKHISTLNMAYVREDRAKLAPMILDYILIFRKPGENEAPITNDLFYVPVDTLVEYDTESGNGDVPKLERQWRLFQGDPARNEWPIMLIDNQLINRMPGSIRAIKDAQDTKEETPSFVKVENGLWLVPVENAWVTNESWIEYADGIAQETEYNRRATMHDSTRQKERFGIYLEKVKHEYQRAKEYIELLDAKMQSGDITEKEILSMLAGAFIDIDQTQTLNTPYTRGRTKEAEGSDKHVCPFSIPLVDRLIRLYSNPTETVLDPFMGVGTVPMKALELGRKTIGLELKAEYFDMAASICEQVANKPKQLSLF